MFFEPSLFPDTLGYVTKKGLIFNLGFDTPPGGEIDS